MGEIADGLINGDFDFYTGEYIGNGMGFPRTHNRSLPWERNKRDNRYSRRGEYSNREKFSGVMNWLMLQGGHGKEDTIFRRLLQWAADHNMQVPSKSRYSRICQEISKDFPAFVKWFKEKTNHQ